MANLFLVDQQTAPSKTSANRPPDWQQREAALDIRQSWIIEAPAGSGKTGLLIQRFLKLLGDESVTDPEQVMAITFTVKATSELRERVLSQLEAASRSTPLASEFDRLTRELAEAVLVRDRLFGWNLLDNAQRLRIRTIDSVCAEIARSLPILSGSGGQLSPVLDAAPLHREAARRTLMQFGGRDPALTDALRTILLHRDGNLGDVERLLAEMLQWRDQWGDLIPLSGADLTDEALEATVLPRLELALDHAICSGLTRLAKSVPPEILESLANLAGHMGDAEGYKGTPSPISLCKGLHTAPGETAEHLEHWRALIHLLTTKTEGTWRSERGLTGKNLGFEYDRKVHHPQLVAILREISHRDDLIEVFGQTKTLPPAKYPEEQWDVSKALFRILGRALIELQFVFAERGECDFTELGLLARTALRRDEDGDDLAAALGLRLQHLLVDEMQDTSTSQYDLIQQLTQGWDGQSQTVFLVGDPKQSIYLFRQARVERFLRTMQTGLLGDLPVQSLRLTANFRSQRTLVEQVNADFSLLFPREVSPDHREEVAFVAAEPVRPATDTAALSWHIHTIPSTLAPAEATSARQQQTHANAQAIREIALAWRARPLPPGRSKPWSIAVLVRSRTVLTEIVAAFKEIGDDGPVPFRAVDIEPLGDRHEVLDLFALTRALLHPADRVAWFAILRAPWCGLTLADLHQLAGADDSSWAEVAVEELISRRGELLSPDGCQRLERIWTVMQSAARQRARMTTAQLVERCWRSLGGDVWLDAESTQNALQYLQLLDRLESDSRSISISTLEQNLKKLYAAPAIAPGAVDLMTIHGSKGLEWDVVILPSIERRGRNSQARLLTWAELDSGDPDAAHLMLAPVVSKGEESGELNGWLRSIESAREAAERKRLFYVACTRAREELHIFAVPGAKDGTITAAADSLLKAALPAAQQHAASEFAVATQGEEQELQMAAAAEGRPAPKLHRLPASFNVAARFAEHTPLQAEAAEIAPRAASFERPEGSFIARAFGNAVHAFMELLGQQIATGETPDSLSQTLPKWAPRISAVLRAEGLAPAVVDRLAQRVQTALSNTLSDPIGRWILAAHKGAGSEQALTSWEDQRTSIRLDRIFRASSEPALGGDDCLWVVDFKTTMHGREGLAAFLEKEREKYAPQMLAYAAVLAEGDPDPRPVHMMLYYPMMAAHTWWSTESPA